MVLPSSAAMALRFLLFLSLFPMLLGGPLAYGICQTGCNAMVVACYAAAGFTFGTVTAGAGVPAAVIGCNAALGTRDGLAKNWYCLNLVF